jgi:hypothetical protein
LKNLTSIALTRWRKGAKEGQSGFEFSLYPDQQELGFFPTWRPGVEEFGQWDVRLALNMKQSKNIVKICLKKQIQKM